MSVTKTILELAREGRGLAEKAEAHDWDFYFDEYQFLACQHFPALAQALEEAVQILTQVAQPWRDLPPTPNFESATALGLWQKAYAPILQARAFLAKVGAE